MRTPSTPERRFHVAKLNAEGSLVQTVAARPFASLEAAAEHVRDSAPTTRRNTRLVIVEVVAEVHVETRVSMHDLKAGTLQKLGAESSERI